MLGHTTGPDRIWASQSHLSSSESCKLFDLLGQSLNCSKARGEHDGKFTIPGKLIATDTNVLFEKVR